MQNNRGCLEGVRIVGFLETARLIHVGMKEAKILKSKPFVTGEEVGVGCGGDGG